MGERVLGCVCGRRGVTRSFPVAIARERGECPLQRRSVLALWESRRATTLLAFCKKQMDNTDVVRKHHVLVWFHQWWCV